MVLVPLHATPGRPAAAADPGSAADRMDLGLVGGARYRHCGGALHCWPGRAAAPRRPLAGAAQPVVPGRRARVHCLATMSALGAYDTVLFSVHMVQHMILMMVAPMFLALGAPVTLALRTLPPPAARHAARRAALTVARVLTFAPLTLALFIATPFALVLLLVLRALAALGVLACVPASALPDHRLPADVATDGDRPGSRKNQLSAAAADAVPDAALPRLPRYLDHELDHADRGELVSGVQSDLAAQPAG